MPIHLFMIGLPIHPGKHPWLSILFSGSVTMFFPLITTASIIFIIVTISTHNMVQIPAKYSVFTNSFTQTLRDRYCYTSETDANGVKAWWHAKGH